MAGATKASLLIFVAVTFHFPPVSALITAGGRLLLSMLEKMVADAGGSYLMCDTDSMAIVASEHGGLVSCIGGAHKMPNGSDAIKALSWSETRQIVDRFKTLNPYNKKIVPGSILNVVEEINFDSDGKQRQVYGYGISAMPYTPLMGRRRRSSRLASTDLGCTIAQKKDAIPNATFLCG